MSKPCGHPDADHEALAGRPWQEKDGWSPLCRVCWMWANSESYRRSCEGLPPPPPPAPLPAVPRGEWPAWARAVSWLRRPGEAGAGDTLRRLIAGVGGEKWKAWYKRRTGQDCGCEARRRAMNEKYPYEGDGR